MQKFNRFYARGGPAARSFQQSAAYNNSNDFNLFYLFFIFFNV